MVFLSVHSDVSLFPFFTLISVLLPFLITNDMNTICENCINGNCYKCQVMANEVAEDLGYNERTDYNEE